MRTEKRSVLFCSGVVASIAIASFGSLACSEEGEDPGGLLEGTPTGGRGGGSVASGGTGVGVGPGLGAGTGGKATLMIPSNGTAGGSTGPAVECAGQTSKADIRPVNMFIQFDRSGSMLDNDKWGQAKAALTAFFQDPASDGLKVALRFFPHDLPAVGCQGGNINTCDAAACAQPLVPLGVLTKDVAPTDAQEGALVNAVAMATPDPVMAFMPGTGMGMGGMAAMTGGTPIFPALQGALSWATANLAATPGERTVVVLVTDGEPNGCDTNIRNIANLAANALMTSGIPTYAIGIQGANERQMNQIAEAGGTERAYFAGNAATAQQDLIAALNAIRGSVLACQFPVPASTTGIVDPGTVNVQFTKGDGTVVKVFKTMDMTACPGEGWFYDNAAQTSISLCDSTCQQVQADGSAQLQVKVGCTTEVR